MEMEDRYALEEWFWLMKDNEARNTIPAKIEQLADLSRHLNRCLKNADVVDENTIYDVFEQVRKLCSDIANDPRATGTILKDIFEERDD